MIKTLLVQLYNSFLGRFLAQTHNALFSTLHQPKMLWGYLNSDGTWLKKTRVSSSSVISHKSRVDIGDNVYIGHYCILDGIGGLKIGVGSQISARTAIYTHSSHISIRLYGHHYTEVDENDKKAFCIEPVTIGDFVYIGTNATILQGVTIGHGALIAAGTVVKEDVANYQIMAGSPARVVGSTKEMDEAYLVDPCIKQWYDEWQANV